MPFPKVYDEVKKTLCLIRRVKYGDSPKNGSEVLSQFATPDNLQKYGTSASIQGGKLFYDVIIEDTYENCIFASTKSIELILEYTNQRERFFILDSTFRITPAGVWQQVVALHISFGLKVNNLTKSWPF